MNNDEAPTSPKDAALKLALEALENHPGNYKLSKAECAEYRAVEDAIREALAEQPAQHEPVAWMWRCKPYCNWPEWSVSLKRPADSGRDGHKPTEGYEDMPLYTSPPAQRKPLTDEEIAKLANDFLAYQIEDYQVSGVFTFARAIEAAHNIKEKNT